MDKDTLAFIEDDYKKKNLAKLSEVLKQENPTNNFRNFGRGIWKGIGDTFLGAGQLANDVVGKPFKNLDPYIQKRDAEYKKATNNNDISSKAGEAASLFLGSGLAKAGLSVIGKGRALMALPQSGNIVNTIGKTAAISAGQGAITPIAQNTQNNWQERGKNTLIGTGAGVLGSVATNAGGTLINAASKNMKNASNAAEIAQLAGITNKSQANKLATQIVANSKPTMPEIYATTDNKLLKLKNQLQNKSRDDGQFLQRENENNSARINALQKIAQTPEKINELKKFRMDTAKSTYADLQRVKIDKELNYALNQPFVKKELTQTQAHFNADIDPAKRIKAIETINKEKYLNPQAVRQINTALNNTSSDAYIRQLRPDDVNLAYKQKDLFNNAVERLNPNFNAASKEYQKNSMPITDSEYANKLLKSDATLDANGVPKITYNQYKNTLNSINEQQYKPSEEASKAFKNVKDDLQRATILNNTGATSGSNTAFNLHNNDIPFIPRAFNSVIDSVNHLAGHDAVKTNYLLNPEAFNRQINSNSQSIYNLGKNLQTPSIVGATQGAINHENSLNNNNIDYLPKILNKKALEDAKTKEVMDLLIKGGY
jgi:hypothetical protein